MAERLKAFPGGPRYDWDNWLDGTPWLLRKGEDYDIDTDSMRAAASRAAKQRKKKVRTRVIADERGEGLALEAYPPEAP
jgi:hypothetical protein